jgi:hypothetical protein
MIICIISNIKSKYTKSYYFVLYSLMNEKSIRNILTVFNQIKTLHVFLCSFWLIYFQNEILNILLDYPKKKWQNVEKMKFFFNEKSKYR